MPEPAPAEISRIQPAPIAFPAREWMGAPLPTSLTTFVGRSREVQDVAALLRRSDVRLLTITGPGGVGKTRLSLEVASEIADEFSDGVTFVDLTPVRAPDLVGAAVARDLGLREAGDRTVTDRIVDALGDRHLLIVFDNFEHVVAAAPVIIDLLKGCPRVTALVTSREPLRLMAEHVVVLAPLAIGTADQPADCFVESDAVRLFIERAQAVRSEFTLTEANVGVVHDIVRRLDGLPLAIELAAARLAHLSPDALRQRLERRLPLLTGGARDSPERQQTLRNAIDWSHDLLTPGEQRVFRRLAVFVGGCTLDAAENVIAQEGDIDPTVLDDLASLVSRSLLRFEENCDGGPRYTMLETVREYALEQLAERQEDVAIRDRHAAYFLHLAQQADPATWGGPDQLWWLDKLDAESSNFRGALAWLEPRGNDESFLRLAASLGGFWHYRSHRVEGRAWLTRALAVDGATSLPSRAMALVKLGMLERVLGRPQAALELTLQGLELRRGIGGLRGTGRCLASLGTIYIDVGDYCEAGRALEEAAAALEVVGDIVGLARTRLGLGQMAIDKRDFVRGHSFLLDALTLSRTDGFHLGIASTLLELGWAEAEYGEIDRAAAYVAESISFWVQIRNKEGLVAALTATASLAATGSDFEAAARLLGTASSTSESLGYVAPKREAARYECAASAARAALGQCYAVVWKAGRSQSIELAATEADGVLRALMNPAEMKSGVPKVRTMFTPREVDVLRLLVEGRSDREIGYALGISYRTVTSYVRNILTKFEVASRTAAATEAIRRGLVP